MSITVKSEMEALKVSHASHEAMAELMSRVAWAHVDLVKHVSAMKSLMTRCGAEAWPAGALAEVNSAIATLEQTVTDMESDSANVLNWESTS